VYKCSVCDVLPAMQLGWSGSLWFWTVSTELHRCWGQDLSGSVCQFHSLQASAIYYYYHHMYLMTLHKSLEETNRASGHDMLLFLLFFCRRFRPPLVSYFHCSIAGNNFVRFRFFSQLTINHVLCLLFQLTLCVGETLCPYSVLDQSTIFFLFSWSSPF